MRPDMATAGETPIACTLTAGDYKERLGQIAALARDSLRSHERNGLVLILRYDVAAADQVRDMVRRERDCCAFLTLTGCEDGDEIVVTVSAPEEAEAAAETLFQQFVTPAPSGSANPARVALACSCAAVACGAACVVPLALPAVMLASMGTVLAWLAEAHGWMTNLAILAVVAAWLWILQQAIRTKLTPSVSTLAMMGIATFLLALALAWPLVEPQIAEALGD
jgi:hypothetical protein